MKNSKKSINYIKVGNQKYEYSIRFINKKVVFFECKAAHMAQQFLAEDIAALLIDLPELILGEQEYEKQHPEVMRFRLSSAQKKEIKRRAAQEGYDSVSRFLRDLALNKA